MDLHVLGHCAGWPDSVSPSSGYVVTTGSQTILVDCGPGIARALADHPLLPRVTAVFVSHLHADHFFDLPVLVALIGRLQAAGDAVAERPTVFVPSGGKRVLATMNDLFGKMTSPYLTGMFDSVVQTVEYEPGQVLRSGDCEIRAVLMRHIEQACGARLTGPDGRVLGYSADTAFCPGLIEVATDADLFLCESSWDTPNVTGHGHLCADEAGQAATLARAGRLVLTHYVSGTPEQLRAKVEAASRRFDGPVYLARCSDTYSLVG